MLNGRLVAALMRSTSLRIWSGFRSAQGSDPRPPAVDTAIASALPCDPAIGAWMIGSSIPSRAVINSPCTTHYSQFAQAAVRDLEASRKLRGEPVAMGHNDQNVLL